jgi:hypothetical protein
MVKLLAYYRDTTTTSNLKKQARSFSESVISATLALNYTNEFNKDYEILKQISVV